MNTVTQSAAGANGDTYIFEQTQAACIFIGLHHIQEGKAQGPCQQFGIYFSPESGGHVRYFKNTYE